MHNRARVLAVCGTLVVASFVSALAVSAQDKKPAKVDKAVVAEQQATVKLMDDVMGGQAAPADFSFAWTYHAMKSRDGKIFIPFILTFDKTKALPANATYYLRVVNPATAAETMKKVAEHKQQLETATTRAKLNPDDEDAMQAAEKLRNSAPKIEFPFEDLRMGQNVVAAPTGQARYTGALAVAPGDYDVYVLFKEPTNQKDKKAPAPKAAVVKFSLTAPNFWTDELATSSIFITNQSEQLKTPPTQEEVSRYPYIFGMTKLTPPTEANPKFTKKDELSILFYIYNTGLDKTTGKPDLVADFNFYRKADGAEKFFNKTNPQALNASTLGAQFDVKAGHQLIGGQAIPLASFPEGEYRLEIKLTDKVTGKTKVENSTFTITAG